MQEAVEVLRRLRWYHNLSCKGCCDWESQGLGVVNLAIWTSANSSSALLSEDELAPLKPNVSHFHLEAFMSYPGIRLQREDHSKGLRMQAVGAADARNAPFSVASHYN